MAESRPLRKVLIANRGEIARRVLRTCHRMGLSTVAVYSDADEHAPFVREADEAVRLGPAPAAQSYLNVDAILDAIERTGADAVHPGYGFLSENAAFAKRLEERGVIFVGPTAATIAAMGLKREAKETAERAGLPVVPGFDGRDDGFEAAAGAIGYPVLIKASAGGGGKGMRVAAAPAKLRDAIEAAKREAMKAFGDDALILEKYLQAPRHVEVQILGDGAGRVVHFGERDCSVQRRHQKIIEEAPAPNLSEGMRRGLHDAAVRLGEALQYRSAGTVEFIVEGEHFYFLEVNTRLQVEHPVTEAIYGVDLVEWQLRVAAGESLPEAFSPPSGHAIEARLYAEDSAFLPQTGEVQRFAFSEGLRVDSGVEEGNVVGVHYDPMLAKVIAYGADRHDALRQLRGGLERGVVLGLHTNRAQLVDLLDLEGFRTAALHTGLVADLTPRTFKHTARAAALALLHAERMAAPRGLPLGFSNHRRALPPEFFTLGDARLRVVMEAGRTAATLCVSNDVEGEANSTDASVFQLRALRWSDVSIAVDEDGHRYEAALARTPTHVHVHVLGEDHRFELTPRFREQSSAEPGAALSPMPGTVVQVRVSVGDEVAAGATLVVLEAMKMEQAIVAEAAGRVTAVHVVEGEAVEGGVLVAVVEPAEG
ncbi:MAG: biotin carboxylase N-terminal domain-containing protein [Myxococcota bacterium]